MTEEEVKRLIGELFKAAGVDFTNRADAEKRLKVLREAFLVGLSDHSFCVCCASDERGRVCMCQDNS